MIGELKLVKLSDPILRQKTPRFDFANPPVNPAELYNAMGKSLIETKGVGLAAPQMGLPYRFFVLRSDPVLGMFNPVIVDQSEETTVLEEACLSVPGIVVKIRRPQVIRVRYFDPTGEVKTAKFQDFTARVIQHELNHLDGILITDMVTSFDLERAINKAKKRGYSYLKGELV